jgi:hypothetical protein
MSDFHKSDIGKKYYEKDVPALVSQLKRIADSLDLLTQMQKKKEVVEKKKEAMDRRSMIAEAIKIYEETRKK